MNTDDLQASAAAPLLADTDARRRRPGTALACLRCWRDLRKVGATGEAREAALSGLTGPADTDPTNQRN